MTDISELTLQAAHKPCALNKGQRPSDVMQSTSERKDHPVNKLPNVDSYIVAYCATRRLTTKVNFQRWQTFSQLQNRGLKKRVERKKIAGELTNAQRTVWNNAQNLY